MDKEKLILKVLNRKAKNNNTIDLDAYGAGASDMFDEMKALALPDVTNQRELLIDFANKINENCDDAHIDPNLIDWYIEFKDNL